MYTSSLPMYDDEEPWDDSLDANNPDNFNNDNDSDEEEYIR